MSFQKVLLLDDNDPYQFLSKSTIQTFDPTVEILQAYDGEEALALLKDIEKQPDIIFLDINMPLMNGIEFLKNYDRFENQAMIIVMLTSPDQQSDIEQSKTYECVKKFITKPLDINNLQNIKKSLF